MKLYEENGYLNFAEIAKIKTPFIFIVGGRGIGKTYGAIKYVIENDVKFMLSRRTQKQADMISQPELSPLKSPCNDMGIDYVVKNIVPQCAGIYIDDELRGYTTALSTLSNIRGFDSVDVTMWLYDEFIPERHERILRYEGEGFLNAYETINRNRELKGKEPLKCICMANSNDIGNPIFEILDLITVAEKMQNKGQEIYINQKRGITIIMPQRSPISIAKKGTALYNAVSKSSRFAEMALENSFEKEACICSKNIKEYKLLVSVGNVNIYEHKKNGEYYVSGHRSGTAYVYQTDPTSILQFRSSFRYLLSAYIMDTICFENTYMKREFEKFFNIGT